MKTLPVPRRLCFIAGLLLLAAAPARLHAQATKIFVASFGNDANDGSRGSPKRNFQAAHDAVAVSGQIVVLDTAGYGALAISKSVTVTVPPGVNGFITVSGSTNGVTINSGAGSAVTLRGLIVEGAGSGTSGVGITATTAVGNLSIEDCTVRNIGGGVFFAPTSAAKLYVYNTAVRGCGYGIDVQSDGNETLLATVNGCRLEQNTLYGILATIPGNFPTDSNVSMTDCVISGNGVGVSANGVKARVRLSGCSITANSTGVSELNSGAVLSRGNNTLEDNPNGNVFTSSYSAK